MIASVTMDVDYYSVRMRASAEGRHLSGAERLVMKSELDAVVAELTQRGIAAAKGCSVGISCRIENVACESIQIACLPDLKPYRVQDCQHGRQLAGELLQKAGVPADIARSALISLAQGLGPDNTVMRGAAVVDIRTGQRLEGDPARGVRASMMDLTPSCRAGLELLLSDAGLQHWRVVEALVLAGKVLLAPGVVAELCWSDDPGYVTGYVASPGAGYQRISVMKEMGDSRGGRVFFVDAEVTEVDALVRFLEKQAVLFDRIGEVFSQVEVELT